MPETRFDWVLIGLSAVLVALFLMLVAPTFFGDRLNVLTAVEGMFANPYATWASIDVIFTYLVLAAWVVHESEQRGVRHGWVALVIGLVWVAVGLAVYLLVRHREIGPQSWR